MRGNLVDQVDDLVDSHPNLESVRIHLLTDFAFESLPVKRSDIHVGGTWWLLLLLGEHPTF